MALFLLYFNPRPPRGGRQQCKTWHNSRAAFQSTPSARRATAVPVLLPCNHRYFNPRPPRGERHFLGPIFCRGFLFQSTPSARRATAYPHPVAGFRLISIHALREESDPTGRTKSRQGTNFNPRPPRGERHPLVYFIDVITRFQSTPSARRATRRQSARHRQGQNFNPRPPRGERPHPAAQQGRRF